MHQARGGLSALPPIHKDPFDRLIIATIPDGLRVITATDAATARSMELTVGVPGVA